MLWRDSSVPFPFGKDGSGILANCSLCGIEATLFFSAGPVWSSISAEACAILHALCWSRQHQQVCHFSSPTICLSLCPCHSVLSFIFPFTSISVRNYFLSSPVLSGYNGSPDIRSFRTTTRLMSWPDGEHYLFPQQSLVVTLLISGIHSFLFSDCRRTVLSKFFDTQAPSISTEQLVLPGHACCDLSRLRCNGHSLLLSSYLSRIGRIENSSFLQRLRTPVPEHFSSHSALSSYELFASLALWQFSVSLRPLSLRICPDSGAPWFSAINLCLRRGRVTTTTVKMKLQTHYYVTNRVRKFRRF